MRSLLVFPAAFLLATFAPAALYRAPVPPNRPMVIAAPVPLDADRPGRTRLGPLRYLGGWQLTSNDARFGGISALHVRGGRVIAIADTGLAFSFRVPATRAAPLAIAPVECGTGRRKQDRDSEALAVVGDTAWAAFENANAICRYRLPGWTSLARARPGAMRKWPANSGAEAMVRLRDGRFLLFAEGPVRDGTSRVLLFPGDPTRTASTPVILGYRPPAGFRITDAAELPDGRLLFLNRKLSLMEGVAAQLTVGRMPPRPGAGAVLAGRLLAELRPPVVVDNMEGLSVTREQGRTILWLASDDNFIPLQRSLLLKFALEN